MLGKTEGRRRGQQRMRWLDGSIDPMDMSLSKLWDTVKDREAWCVALLRVAKRRDQATKKQQQQMGGELQRIKSNACGHMSPSSLLNLLVNST